MHKKYEEGLLNFISSEPHRTIICFNFKTLNQKLHIENKCFKCHKIFDVIWNYSDFMASFISFVEMLAYLKIILWTVIFNLVFMTP